MTRLDFFGCTMSVHCTPGDAADLTFFFGPHAVPAGPSEVNLDLHADNGFFRSLLAKDRARKVFTLRRNADLLDHREFRDWSSVPSPLPPFRLLAERVCVVQATVLHRDERVLALVGTPYSGKTSVGLRLASRGWVIVSDQLLVLDRATGDVLPYCVPVGLRGATLAAARRTGLVRGETRSTISAETGEVVLVRPETLSAPIPAETRLRRPTLVLVRRAAQTRLERTTLAGLGRLRAWPAEGRTGLRAALDRHHAVLELAAHGGREHAADLVEDHCG